MKSIRNFLAVIGLLTIFGLFWAGFKFMPYYSTFKSFDPQAFATYEAMFDKLMKTGNAADATVWRREVKSGLTVADVEQDMKSVAIELNIKNVGELPLSKQVTAMTGHKQRFLKIYMYCNPLTAAKMVDYSDAYSAYLPCRLALVRDKQGRLWLYSLNMDMMIHGGKPLPPDLKKAALQVREVILAIMNRASTGAF